MRKRIGITGNIGSGKSTVAALFGDLGVPVYSADERAKWLMVNSPDLRAAIKATFGEAAYLEAGDFIESDDLESSKSRSAKHDPEREARSIPFRLNRQYLAGLVFSDPVQLAAMNALVHPAVAADALAWHERQKTPYTLHEAAITFETGGDEALDAVIVVSAPPDVRLARVMQRDGTSADQVLARMDKQWPEEKKVARADFVIDNSGQKLLMPQVLKVHRSILAGQK